MALRAVISLALIGIVASGCGGSAPHPTTTTRVSTVTMPPVVGLTQREALRRFRGIRITVYVYPERNARFPKGVVFRQTPGSGPVPKGALSAIYVSAGPRGPRVGRPFVAHR
jgi:beta-lactam-binding protein with PASTA domain